MEKPQSKTSKQLEEISLKTKKLDSSLTQLTFKIIEWSFFITLCIIAGMFTKDVIQQFQAKKTIMAQSLIDITKLPTIVFCMNWGLWNFSDKKTVNITYRIFPFQNERTHLLEKEPSHFKTTDETVMFEQINSWCFKLNGTLGSSSTYTKGLERHITIEFSNELKEDVLPWEVSAYFTSEENHYGIFNFEWLDGKSFKQVIRLGTGVYVSLNPVEYTYLSQLHQCSTDTFLEQWKKGKLLDTDLSNCSKRCAIHSFLLSEELGIQSCPWDAEHFEHQKCVSDALWEQTYYLQKSVGKRPCHVLEYHGEKIFENTFISNHFRLDYSFAPPEMTLDYSEHLLFDVYGLIVYIGGILGMCISFSFIGLISTILDLIKSKISH